VTRREVGHDDGFVTAETAVLLPVLVLVGTAITVQRSGGLVTVDVRVPIPGAGPLGWLLGPWSVGARSSALDEQAS